MTAKSFKESYLKRSLNLTLDDVTCAIVFCVKVVWRCWWTLIIWLTEWCWTLFERVRIFGLFNRDAPGRASKLFRVFCFLQNPAEPNCITRTKVPKTLFHSRQRMLNIWTNKLKMIVNRVFEKKKLVRMKNYLTTLHNWNIMTYNVLKSNPLFDIVYSFGRWINKFTKKVTYCK